VAPPTCVPLAGACTTGGQPCCTGVCAAGVCTPIG
jgi:hypothetical protein